MMEAELRFRALYSSPGEVQKTKVVAPGTPKERSSYKADLTYHGWPAHELLDFNITKLLNLRPRDLGDNLIQCL